MKIPFSGRAHAYLPEEIDAVSEFMSLRDTMTQGEHLHAFQSEFQKFLATDAKCFAVGSAADALEITAMLLQIKPGDEIIVPAHTYTASVAPFVKAGAVIRWADIDPGNRVVSASTVIPLISSKTKAILVVHLYGFVVDVGEIQKTIEGSSIQLIEDCAQSIGARLNGVRSGASSNFAIFSFHSHKNMSTLGEGGMLLVADPKIAAVVPKIRHNGHASYVRQNNDYWLPAMSDVVMPTLNGEIIWPGNFCLSEVSCLVGRKLLARVDQMNAIKRSRALDIIDELRQNSELEFHREDSERHNYHLLVAKMRGGKRDSLIRKLFNDFDIQCAIQYCPLYRYDLYKKAGFGDTNLPHTDEFYDNMVSFPFNQTLSDDEINYMVGAIKTSLASI